MNSFTTKSFLMLCLIIIILISSSITYFADFATFKGKNELFIPIFIGLLLTLIRFYNNISEKTKIIDELNEKNKKSLNQSSIEFETCPEYWTKVSHNDNVYCHNNYTDVNNKTTTVGGKVTEDVNSDDVSDDDSSVKDNIFANQSITEMRAKAKYDDVSGGKTEVVEPYTENEPTENNSSHRHNWTYYAHKGDIEWDGKNFGAHQNYQYDDENHFMNVSYEHSHSGESPFVTNTTSSSMNSDSYIQQSSSNETNWINPYKNGADTYAEINLTELNRTNNKCDLVKNFAWVEAMNKCANINKKFDLDNND